MITLGDLLGIETPVDTEFTAYPTPDRVLENAASSAAYLDKESEEDAIIALIDFQRELAKPRKRKLFWEE